MLNSPQKANFNTGDSSGASAIVALALLGFCTALYFISPVLALVGAAGMLVFLFAFRRPALYLAVAFAFGILPQSVVGDSSNALVSFSDLMAALMIVVLLVYVAAGRVRPTLGPLKVPLLLYLSIALLASLNAWRGHDAVVSLGRYIEFTFFTTLLFAAFIRTPTAMERCFILLLVTETFLGLTGVIGFAAGARNGLYILGMHKNSIGPSLACGVVVGLVYLLSPGIAPRFKPWILGAFTLSLIGTILSLSRGAWAATVVAVLVVLALQRQARGLLVMSALAIPIFLVCWSVLPQDAAQYAGDISLHSHTMQFRLDHQAQAMDLWAQHPFLGTGVGLRKAADPENVYVLTLAETGVLGLAGFLFLLGSFYALVRRVYRLISRHLLWDSSAGRVLLCCAGVFTVTVVHGTVDAYWRRGVVFLAWAAAGMCIALYLHLKRQKIPAASPGPAAEGVPNHAF